MKKLLFIAFALVLYTNMNSFAAVQEVVNQETANRIVENKPQNINIPSPAERFADEKDFKKYLIKRLKSVPIMQKDKNSGLYGDSATSAVEDELPPEYREKSFFEKIYDSAIKRATETPSTNNHQELDPRILQPELWEQQQERDLGALNISLPPFDEKVAVPALEHIPYLYTQIVVLPSGQLKIEETIMLISNAKKLRYPLIKSIPSYVLDREGKPHNIDVKLDSVTINGQPISYNIQKRQNNFLIKPDVTFPLDAGIYKYVFNYIVDRQIVQYDNFDELNWDVSGGVWNLVISRIGASVVLPQGTEALGQRVLVGYPFHYSPERAIITKDKPNVLGFAAKVPLFIAEGMPITVVLPKNSIQSPSLSQKINYVLSDYGTIIIPLLGFVVILISYMLSWRYIKRSNKKLPIQFSKSPQMLRYMLTEKFDNKAFGAFLLDLFRKNIIDIQTNENIIILIKRSDDLESLNKQEQKALKIIFADAAVVNVNEFSILNFKKAQKIIEENVKKKFKLFTYKLSSIYVLFGCGMLFFCELFTAYTTFEPSKIFYGMIMVTINIALYLCLFAIKWRKKWANLAVKFN